MKIIKPVVQEISDTFQAILALVVICIICVIIMATCRAVRYPFEDEAGKEKIKTEIEILTGTYKPTSKDIIAAVKVKRKLALSKARKNLQKNSPSKSLEQTIKDNLDM